MPHSHMYPSAQGVKVLSLNGDDDPNRLWKNESANAEMQSIYLQVQGTLPQKRPSIFGMGNSVIGSLSEQVNFAEDVVREKAFHALPYDQKYFTEALDISEHVPPKPLQPKFHGRHNNRLSARHLPCHIKSRASHKLKPIKRKIMERARAMHRQALQQKSEEDVATRKSEISGSHQSVFLTESSAETRGRSTSAPPMEEALTSHPSKSSIRSKEPTEKKEKPRDDWDTYVLSRMSEDMSHWLVYEKTRSGGLQDRLKNRLHDWYGAPTEDPTELIKDPVMDEEVDVKAPKTDGFVKRKWKKPEAKLLEKALGMDVHDPSYPYQDGTDATFYRLAHSTRREHKNQQKEEAGAINKTAALIQVKTVRPPSPLTMRDVIDPRAGKTIYDTDNAFQRERLSGVQQIHQPFDDPKRILLQNTNTYRKQFQEALPAQPDKWHPLTASEERKKAQENSPRKMKVQRGMQRWAALPDMVDENIEQGGVLPPGVTREMTRSPDHKHKRRVRNNKALINIVTEWRHKYQVNSRYADSTPDDLLRDMQDPHPLVRMKAIATVARAAEYRAPTDESSAVVLQQVEKVSGVDRVPENLIVALQCLLNDPELQVKRMAAVTLYSLGKPCDEALVIMRESLRSGNSVDRWAAAQCLAHFGACDSVIIGEILNNMLSSGDTVVLEKCYNLLANLSISSHLPMSLIAEQLNAPTWRHRAIACQVLPKLNSHLNKDVTQKLCRLMWDDWHSEVRKSAAQALGKTGHGKDVHDQLKQRLISSDEGAIIDALIKIGHLGIMTARLLPPFLACFENHYVTVREQACKTCFELRIYDDQVIHSLLHLAGFDPVWKVKATAIQALTQMGRNDELTLTTLLWALRYESAPGVRAEACRALHVLNMTSDPDTVQIFQDRLLVEPDTIVRREIERVLQELGFSLTEDMDMVADIKQEVRRLCTRGHVSDTIYLQQEWRELERNKHRLIYSPPSSEDEAEGKVVDEEPQQKPPPPSPVQPGQEAQGSKKTRKKLKRKKDEVESKMEEKSTTDEQEKPESQNQKQNDEEEDVKFDKTQGDKDPEIVEKSVAVMTPIREETPKVDEEEITPIEDENAQDEVKEIQENEVDEAEESKPISHPVEETKPSSRPTSASSHATVYSVTAERELNELLSAPASASRIGSASQSRSESRHESTTSANTPRSSSKAGGSRQELTSKPPSRISSASKVRTLSMASTAASSRPASVAGQLPSPPDSARNTPDQETNEQVELTEEEAEALRVKEEVMSRYDFEVPDGIYLGISRPSTETKVEKPPSSPRRSKIQMPSASVLEKSDSAAEESLSTINELVTNESKPQDGIDPVVKINVEYLDDVSSVPIPATKQEEDEEIDQSDNVARYTSNDTEEGNIPSTGSVTEKTMNIDESDNVARNTSNDTEEGNIPSTGSVTEKTINIESNNEETVPKVTEAEKIKESFFVTQEES